MELYKKLGLIYEQENGIKQIANFDNLIGSESQSAFYKRQQNKLEKFQQNSNKIKILDTRDKIEDKDSNLVNLSKECVSKKTTGTHAREAYSRRSNRVCEKSRLASKCEEIFE